MAPQTLIPEAVDERAEKARDEHEAVVVKEGDVGRVPVGVQHDEVLGDGAGESQNAQQQLSGVQHHCVHGFVHGHFVLPHLPGLQHDPHVGEEDDNSHHREEQHIHRHSELHLDRGGVHCQR